jgi:hypothetical protein
LSIQTTNQIAEQHLSATHRHAGDDEKYIQSMFDFFGKERVLVCSVLIHGTD